MWIPCGRGCRAEKGSERTQYPPYEKEYYTAIHVPKNTIRKAQTRQPAVSAGCGSRRLYGPRALGATIWQMAWESRLALVGKVRAS